MKFPVYSFAAVILFGAVAFSQTPGGVSQVPVQDVQQDAYRQQMRSLMEELRNAKTDEARRSIYGRVRQAREQYRAAHPPKELTPAERDAQRQKMEETLKKDPFQWQLYQLRQSIGNAKTNEEREGLRAQMQALREKHAAEAEAKLTPEQRAERQARAEKNTRMQAELKPILERSHSATSIEERKTIRAQMREIFEKYR